MGITSHSVDAYRSNVGIALFGPDGRVLIARRLADDGPEIILPGFEWQMPQGGIDSNEDPEAAAQRELWEETGVTSARVIAAHPGSLTYDFPLYGGRPHRLTRFRGQRQRWYAMRFEGPESEIDVTRAVNGAEPEFSAWRWERLDRVAALVVPFKRTVYEEVARNFGRFATSG